MFDSYEIAFALKTDSRFNWLSEYDEMEEKDFVLKFEEDFMSFNVDWINERAWENPSSNKAVYGGR
jgi:2-oxo-4-hydroxy-4-carboxy--5-ureidoimidazoline (OHCU) decarboxylase